LASRARPCATRTRLFGDIASPNGALRAPRPSQLRCLLFDPQNILNLSNLGRPRQGLYSFNRTTEAMKYAPRPAHRSFADTFPAIFWGQNYVSVPPYALIFFGFPFLYSFWICSFCYSLLFNLFLLISSYPSLLTSSYSSRRY
jgi:hypothetical protein